MIERTFKQQLRDFLSSECRLKIGDPILAQMAGYGPWPGNIEGFTKDQKRIKIYFYGSHDRGTVDIQKAIPFSDAFQTIRLIVLRRKIGYWKEFEKGVRELEIEYGIPNTLSSLREMEALE